jgi:hypothetical protein
MIQVDLKDSFGYFIDIDDIVMLEYKNEKVKFIGALQFRQDEARFVLDNLDGDYEYWPNNDWTIIKLLCDHTYTIRLEQFFGRHENFTKERMQQIENIINEK